MSTATATTPTVSTTPAANGAPATAQPEPKRVKVPSNTIRAARVAGCFNEDHVNVSVTASLNKLKAQLEPYLRAEKALESGKEAQYDAAGKQLVNVSTKEKLFTDLSEARKEQLKKFLAENSDAVNKCREEIAALQHARIRFSEDSDKVMRDIVVAIVRELIQHAFADCLIADENRVQVSHLHGKGVESLICFPLIANLPSWKNPPAPKKAEKATPAPVVAAGTDAASTPAVAATPAPVAAAEPAAEADSETNFIYHIIEICSEMAHPTKLNADGTVMTKTVEKKGKDGALTKVTTVDKDMTGKYAEFRTTQQFKQYLNDLIFEFLGRVSPLVQLQLTALNVKTINREVIESVIMRIMVDGSTVTETLKYDRVKVPNPELVKALREERKKAKAEKREPTDKRTEAELPTVDELVITKVLKFADPRYEQFQAKLNSMRESWPVETPAVAVPAPAVAST